MQYHHIKKHRKIIFQLLVLFLLLPMGRARKKRLFFMHSLLTMCKCILFLENGNALFPCFLLYYGKNGYATDLHALLCRPMHIQQGIRRFKRRRGNLNSWEVKIRRVLLTSISFGFIKAVSIATSFSQDTQMLHFLFFFSGKTEGKMIIFPSYPIFSSSLTQARLHSEGALWT